MVPDFAFSLVSNLKSAFSPWSFSLLRLKFDLYFCSFLDFQTGLYYFITDRLSSCQLACKSSQGGNDLFFLQLPLSKLVSVDQLVCLMASKVYLKCANWCLSPWKSKNKAKTIRRALWWTLREFSTLSCDSRSHLWALFLCRWFELCNVRHKWDSVNVPASSCTVFFLNSAFPKCYQASVLCIPAHLHCNYF